MRPREGGNRRENRQGDNRQSGNRRGRFHRRWRRDFSRRQRGERPDPKDCPPCPICSRPVNELSNAICHASTLKPAHFDCVMKQIEASEGLAANEKICYLGKGSFGIIRFQKIGGSMPFIIRKRIQYEDFEETPEWRKKLDRLQHREKPHPPAPPPG